MNAVVEYRVDTERRVLRAIEANSALQRLGFDQPLFFEPANREVDLIGTVIQVISHLVGERPRVEHEERHAERERVGEQAAGDPL